MGRGLFQWSRTVPMSLDNIIRSGSRTPMPTLITWLQLESIWNASSRSSRRRRRKGGPGARKAQKGAEAERETASSLFLSLCPR